MKCEKVELLMVGSNAVTVPCDSTIQSLIKTKNYLCKINCSFEDHWKIQEMINHLEYSICILGAIRQNFDNHKGESFKIQDVIKSCGGFITFKEYLAMRTSEDKYFELAVSVGKDDDFPNNADVTWKSYRLILKYIIKNYSYRYWDEFKDLFYEYQNIIEGRWYP